MIKIKTFILLFAFIIFTNIKSSPIPGPDFEEQFLHGSPRRMRICELLVPIISRRDSNGTSVADLGNIPHNLAHGHYVPNNIPPAIPIQPTPKSPSIQRIKANITNSD